jgi:hypothetical protein
MRTFVANIVTQQLFIQAKDEEEAEALYDAYFDGQDTEDKVEFCDSNVFHYMEVSSM